MAFSAHDAISLHRPGGYDIIILGCCDIPGPSAVPSLNVSYRPMTDSPSRTGAGRVRSQSWSRWKFVSGMRSRNDSNPTLALGFPPQHPEFLADRCEGSLLDSNRTDCQQGLAPSGQSRLTPPDHEGSLPMSLRSCIAYREGSPILDQHCHVLRHCPPRALEHYNR